ncbi:hypothetical protein [Microvirga massiliensis]|uniref:hypothetical protein n=1 Tax=Microvirga massiliensis TaxID=1033741 RepID=UPI0011CBA5E1|nr:hypothetical protein [Microvirga massiliensis]
MISQSPAARRGTVGISLRAGDVVLTATGRETTSFPKIDVTSDRKATNTLKRVSLWLMDNAIAEAESRGDDFNLRMFEACRTKPSQADRDSAEHYLFDPACVQIVPPLILRPVTLPALKTVLQSIEDEAA